MSKKKIGIFKILLTIIVLLIIVGAVIYLFPLMKELSTTEGRMAFKEKIDGLGVISILVLFALQVAQIFLVIIPGEPIEILAGMCYGTIGGAVFILASASIISTIIFFLVRKFGKQFVYNFLDERKVEKIENSKIFQNPKKIETIMLILFLLPGTPKDLLVYIAGLLPIKPTRFILISTLARIPSVVSSTFGGDKLLSGNWKMIIILNIIVLILAIIIVYIYNKFDKDKTAEEALKTIK